MGSNNTKPTCTQQGWIAHNRDQKIKGLINLIEKISNKSDLNYNENTLNIRRGELMTTLNEQIAYVESLMKNEDKKQRIEYLNKRIKSLNKIKEKTQNALDGRESRYTHGGLSAEKETKITDDALDKIAEKGNAREKEKTHQALLEAQGQQGTGYQILQ